MNKKIVRTNRQSIFSLSRHHPMNNRTGASTIPSDSGKSQAGKTYVSGHHESVLRSHAWRTAGNSASYLIGSLRPHMHILDVGCGPGTITIDLATLVPEGQVIGMDYAQDVLEQARTKAAELRVDNVQFVVGDVNRLDFPDSTFDVVHAHQVLQHLGDPVLALREMRRVTKPGGIVAVRETDFSTMTWYPDVAGLANWKELYLRVARAKGGEPDAGRRLHAWARKAGFDPLGITATASTWCFYTPSERVWWSSLWADRVIASSFAHNTVEGGHATQEQLKHISQAWREWGAKEDGWFAVLHGEILCCCGSALNREATGTDQDGE